MAIDRCGATLRGPAADAVLDLRQKRPYALRTGHGGGLGFDVYRHAHGRRHHQGLAFRQASALLSGRAVQDRLKEEHDAVEYRDRLFHDLRDHPAD